MSENELASLVLDICMIIHKRLGPGLLESVYESILMYELGHKGISIERQVPIPLIWDGIRIDESFRADIIVDKRLLLELKSTEKDSAIYKKQVLTYLKISGIKLGLLINFGQPYLKDGITRLVNGLDE